jgi:hypothetical protein
VVVVGRFCARVALLRSVRKEGLLMSAGSMETDLTIYTDLLGVKAVGNKSCSYTRI